MFRAAITDEDCVLNRTGVMDLMRIRNKMALHMVDNDIKLFAALFLQGETNNDVWNEFVLKWVAPYNGYPEMIVSDQGPQFQSADFAAFLNSAGVNKKNAGVESHSSLGEVERNHAFLSNILDKARCEHSGFDNEIVLKLATTACIDTAGPSGLVPKLLVFVVIQRIFVIPRERPAQKQRSETLHTARKEMSKAIARMRLQTAFRTNVPASAYELICIEDNVLVYRGSPIECWVGTFKVIDIKKEAVTIVQDGRLVRFSIDRCNVYNPPDVINNIEKGFNKSDLEREITENTGSPNLPINLESRYSNIDDTLAIRFVVRALKHKDLRVLNSDFEAVKEQEVQGLIKRNI